MNVDIEKQRDTEKETEKHRDTEEEIATKRERACNIMPWASKDEHQRTDEADRVSRTASKKEKRGKEDNLVCVISERRRQELVVLVVWVSREDDRGEPDRHWSRSRS